MTGCKTSLEAVLAGNDAGIQMEACSKCGAAGLFEI
jgi:hypothetical protein